MLLSPDDVSRYHEQGFLVLGKLLGDEDVASLLSEEERFRLPVAYGGKKNPTLFVNVQLCHRSEPVRRLSTAGPQVQALQSLLGPDVCLTHQQFVTKLPDAADEHSDIPWHQDHGYGELDPKTDVTIWIPLVDSDARNGALQVVPGSHRAGLLPHHSAGVNPLLRESEVPGEPVELALHAGEAVAFSGLLVHGSGPNRSGAPRPAFYLRYCEPATRMLSEAGRSVLEDPHSWMVAGEAPS